LRGEVYSICRRYPSIFVLSRSKGIVMISFALIGITANVGTETKEVVLDRKASIFPEWDKERC
jgi:hypothetical protein